MRPTLIIFAKEPRPGQVKTRLARDIGKIAAAWWYRHQTARLLRRLGQDPRWRTVLAVSPDTAARTSRVWPSGIHRMGQGRGDLGQRMAHAMRAFPRDPVVLIGSDIPGVQAHHITRAFDGLGSGDAVVGPATDGGFWLIGLRRGSMPAPGLFREVRWSGPHALADTLASMNGLRVRFADELADVDRAKDLVES